ncbi:MAG: HK97 gp10 family phage protein [Candidatus Omnitrophica bacterium]|nr:HK97 gp10 family phage protein [Candidatus Omnitrophota bacterium]
MPDGVSVRITGLKELEKKMIELGPKIGRKALKSALVAGAQVIKKEAQMLVPIKTGRLRRAMYIKTMSKPNPFKENVIFGVRHGRKMSKRDLDAYYWTFLEFGTKFIKKVSFIQVAFQKAQGKALEKFKDVLANKISQLVKE